MLKKLKLFCLFVAVFFINTPLASAWFLNGCPTNGNLTDSVFDVFYGDEKEPVGVAFLIDDTNKLFLTAKHVIDDQLLMDDQQTSSLSKEFRLRNNRNIQGIGVKVILDGYAAGTATFKGLMGDWALLKGQKADDLMITPLQLHIDEVSTQHLINSNVYRRNQNASTIIETNLQNEEMKVEGETVNVQPNQQAMPKACSPRHLNVVKISGYDKGDSGSPVTTSDCTVVALTSMFDQGKDQKFWSEEHRKLFDEHQKLQKKLQDGIPLSQSESYKMRLYKVVLDSQMVRIVPVVCIMREIIEARWYNDDSIAEFESDSKKQLEKFEFDSQRLKGVLDRIYALDKDNPDPNQRGSVLIPVEMISRLEDLTWTDLVELERAVVSGHYRQNKISRSDAVLLQKCLSKKEEEIHSEYIGVFSVLVSENSENIENRPNTITSSDNLDPSPEKEIAEELVSNANEIQSTTKITLKTLPQIMPDESRNFGKGLSPRDKTEVAKKLEKYLTGGIPWPKEATPSFKRSIADTALSYAASAYLAANGLKNRWYAPYPAANDLKDQSIVAESLKIIGTVINYGSDKKVLGEERYRQGKDVGIIINRKGLEAGLLLND